MEEVFHVPGDLNVADLATHPGAKLCDLGPNSLWQKGPNFLACRRDFWPVSREFVKTNVDIPDSELRSKRKNLFATVKVICCTIRALCCGTMQSDLTDISIWHTINSVLHYSNCLTKS